MTRSDLEELERTLMAEVVKRRSWGGYSQEAAGVLLLAEAVLKITVHLHEQARRAPKPKAQPKEE